MREILKIKKKSVIISKVLLCTLSFFMVFCFIPIDVHAADNPSTLEVNGIDILSAQDNVVECGSGTAKYDSSTNTLTLDNATIYQKGQYASGINCQGGGLTINLIGTNTITAEDYVGISVITYGEILNFTGSGALTINAGGEGITGSLSNIVIDGCTINIPASAYVGIGTYGGTLTIKNKANINVNSTELTIVGENGIAITDSYVEAMVSNDATNVFYSQSGKINISNSTVKATEIAANPYPAIWGYEIEISNSSTVTSLTTGSNAIYSPNTLSITNSSLTAESPDAPVWCDDSIAISNSIVKAVDTGGKLTNPAIHTGNILSITNGSDVIADGGITASNGMTVTPMNGNLVEFKAGIHENGEQGATHRGNSPYDQEFSFKNNDIELGYTYIHIKDHMHIGDTANCIDKAICIDCGKSFGDINPDRHKNLTKTNEKAATHLENGNIEYYYCDGCNKYFRDKDATEKISLSDTVISKISGHTIDNTGWHYDENNHWNTCECGEILNKSSHTFKWVIDKKATSVEKGSKHEECENCGYKKANVEIPVTGTNTDESNEPNENKPNTDKPNHDKNNGSVKTGDQTNMGLYASLFATSSLFLALILVLRRKKRLTNRGM